MEEGMKDRTATLMNNNPIEEGGSIAVCDAKDSDKVVKYIREKHFSDLFKEFYQNGEIWGVFYDDEGKNILAQTIWGDILTDILL